MSSECRSGCSIRMGSLTDGIKYVIGRYLRTVHTINKAWRRFSLTLAKRLPLTFVHLNEHSHFLAPASRFVLLMESLGTMRLAYKAIQMSSLMPHIFVDNTGYAFTFVVARVLFGFKVLADVHCPTISPDMLNLVWERRRGAYNYQEYVAYKSACVNAFAFG
jgi:hypothetical protein